MGLDCMRTAFLLVGFSGWLAATPTLRLSNTVLGISYVPVGAPNTTATLDAYNTGDGTLSLSVWIPPGVTWVSASVGTGVCAFNVYPGAPCTPIQFTLSTASLSVGMYAASVTVVDAHANDAPQVVVVAAWVGGPNYNFPPSIDASVAPGTAATVTADFVPVATSPTRATCPGIPSSTQDGGTWLSLDVGLNGTMLATSSCSVNIILAPPAQMPAGTYTGVLNYAGTPSPVTMRVESPPYAVPSVSQISLQLAEGAPAMAYPFLPAIALGNEGSIVVAQSVTATGTGVSASVSGGEVLVSVDPGTLAPGNYPNAGSVTIQCNAVNCPLQIPVSLVIVASGAPSIAPGGVADNATFIRGAAVAPGDVLIVEGGQLSSSVPAYASSAPLPMTLGGATVLVNGVAAPLFYSSYGQVAFQLPAATPIGTAEAQVERGGQISAPASVSVVAHAPGIVAVTGTNYNVLDLAHPAKAGDTVLIWAIGLGATNPAVADGAPAPGYPFATVISTPTVQIGGNTVTPQYAVLSPGSVGLYQVAVTLPAGLGPNTFVELTFPGISSNAASLAIQ
jgi:uncharacterized protein (TIGR03437 family)